LDHTQGSIPPALAEMPSELLRTLYTRSFENNPSTRLGE
jgi:hypothetical protein